MIITVCVCESARGRLGGKGWLGGGRWDQIGGPGRARKVEERNNDARSCNHGLIKNNPRGRPLMVGEIPGACVLCGTALAVSTYVL